MGNFERRPVPILQKETLVRVLTNLTLKYKIPPERIIGHREVQKTKCPEKHINMMDIRELVRQNQQKLEPNNRIH